LKKDKIYTESITIKLSPQLKKALQIYAGKKPLSTVIRKILSDKLIKKGLLTEKQVPERKNFEVRR